MGRNVSDSYKEIMSRGILPLTLFKVKFGLEAPEAEREAVFTVNEEAEWSDITKIKDSLMPFSNYATAELNRFVLGDSQQLFPSSETEYLKDKFVTANISDINCEYKVYPTINIQFTNFQTMGGISFIFDEKTEFFPSLIKITAYRDEILVKEIMCEPEGYEYVSEGFEDIRQLKIEILKSNLPFSRTVISQIYFGILQTFTEKNCSNVEQTFSISPISNKLYKSEFKFSIDNFDLQYNIDNKQGVYKYLTEQQPVSIEYSLDGNEWIKCGDYLTSGKAKITNNLATIESIDQVQYMNDTYKKDVFRTTEITLYDLAMNVLLDFGWEINELGEYPFEISEELKNVTTLGTLPVATHAECLQLIASASGMALYTDDRGYICIKPLPQEVSDPNYIIDFNNCATYPEPEEIEPLAEVEISIHKYKAERSSSELHKAEHIVNGNEILKIDYELSTEQTISVPTGLKLNSSQKYGRYCELDVTGNGTFEITISGKKIIDNTSSLTIQNQENGEIAPVDNPLITSYDRAMIVGGIAKDYLKQRIRYSIPWVQDYRVNVGDLVYIETQFSERLLCRVIEIKTSEPALTGTIKVVVIQ